MADNLTVQSAVPATLPDTTPVAAAQGSFSGDTVYAGISLLATSTGAEGSRAFALINPATSDAQTTGNTSLSSIDGKLPALRVESVPVRTGLQAAVANTFTQVHIPAANAQATKTQASAGAGKRNVCTGFTVTLCGGSTAPAAATPITVSVIDGASGGGTYLWRTNICLPATANAIVSFNRSGLWLVGSQATAMTLEFSAAAGANTYESVSFDGVIVTE